MFRPYKFYRYQKDKANLKKVLIEKFGNEKGLQKYEKVISMYKNNLKVKKLE